MVRSLVAAGAGLLAALLAPVTVSAAPPSRQTALPPPVLTVVDTFSTTDGIVVGTTATTVAGSTFSGGAATAGGVAPPDMISGDGGGGWPSGCRDVDESTEQDSWIFGSLIFRFHQQKHWCWSGGSVYDERHNWDYQGGSTSCLDEVYPDNAWFYNWWGVSNSGHYSQEHARVTNCILRYGEWKEFYPSVKIWSHADGSYDVDASS